MNACMTPNAKPLKISCMCFTVAVVVMSMCMARDTTVFTMCCSNDRSIIKTTGDHDACVPTRSWRIIWHTITIPRHEDAQWPCLHWASPTGFALSLAPQRWLRCLHCGHRGDDLTVLSSLEEVSQVRPIRGVVCDVRHVVS